MILIDSTPTPQGLPRRIGWPAVEYKPRTTQIDSPFGGELRLLSKPAERDLSTLESGAVLDYIIAPFQPALTGHGHTLQSVFDPQVLPSTEYEKPSQRGQRRAQIFFWLLTETSWRRLVAHLEMKLHDLQREATTIAGDQAFERLTDLRRQLAGAYGMLAKAQDMAKREFKDEFLSWNVRGKKVSAEAFWSEERARPKAVGVIKASSIDIRDLPQLLGELLERMQTMTRSVNEEIQMVIGSVQVEDARVMRRQTEWTVVLAVLAAIYLPMTLVTGLFGMNITEIDAGPTAPDSWSVIRVWGVVFEATMGSVLVYAVVRYILRYRRVGRMLLGRKMRNIGDGSLHRRVLEFKDRVRYWWLYKNIRQFRKNM